MYVCKFTPLSPSSLASSSPTSSWTNPKHTYSFHHLVPPLHKYIYTHTHSSPYPLNALSHTHANSPLRTTGAMPDGKFSDHKRTRGGLAGPRIAGLCADAIYFVYYMNTLSVFGIHVGTYYYSRNVRTLFMHAVWSGNLCICCLLYAYMLPHTHTRAYARTRMKVKSASRSESSSMGGRTDGPNRRRHRPELGAFLSLDFHFSRRTVLAPRV